MKRTVPKKSHSWWWDSHVSPKKSKWLQENLEEMDQNVERRLKLIEDDADSFAKKAEIYYQKRPDAECYDHVTEELRKSIPSDLQSQGSGISDVSSEPPSSMSSIDHRRSRRKSSPRAAEFEFFLGSGGNGTEASKDGHETSTSDSESESDDSYVNNYASTQRNDDDQGLRKRITELEIELRDVKEKLQMAQEEISEGSDGGSRNESSEILLARIADCKEELKIAREKIRLSEEQISTLQDELQKYKLIDLANGVLGEVDIEQGTSIMETSSKVEKQVTEVRELTAGSNAVVDSELKIQALEEKLKLTKEKLLDSEKEVACLRLELQSKESSIKGLQDELRSAQKDKISAWDFKIEKEKREVFKLQDRIVRYKSNEVRLSVGLRETMSNANKSLSEENSELRAEITRLVKEKTYLEDNLKEMDLRCQSLEEDVRRIKAGKSEMEDMLGAEIEELKAGIAEKNDHIEELNRSLDSLKLNYDTLKADKDALDAKVVTYVAEISSKGIRMSEMSKHMHQLHMEHVVLIAWAEAADKQVEELRSKVQELEREVDRQRELILEGAEEKREAIRQLCFSLEHYRNGYHQLRQAVMGQKLVLAS